MIKSACRRTKHSNTITNIKTRFLNDKEFCIDRHTSTEIKWK